MTSDEAAVSDAPETAAGSCSVSEDEIEQTRGTTEIAYKHGLKVKMILGDYGNFKITTPTDLDRFKTVLEGKE